MATVSGAVEIEVDIHVVSADEQGWFYREICGEDRSYIYIYIFIYLFAVCFVFCWFYHDMVGFCSVRLSLLDLKYNLTRS